MNLSKVVGDFVGEQKSVNDQVNKKIDTVESTLNKKMEGLQSELALKFDNLQYSISRLTTQLQVHEKGKFPSQTQQNPRGVHEVTFTIEPAPKIYEVKAVIALRSGKKIENPVPKAVEKTEKELEKEPEVDNNKEEKLKKNILPPFPQALKSKKKENGQDEILEVLRQVNVNISLLDMIKKVPTYDIFLKDLCTMKRGMNVDKKAFLTEQVSAIIQCKAPVKYKDPGCPTISVNIGGTCVEKALLDLGASVNLLPYSVYKQLGLGELKPTTITLSLADMSIKIPKGTVEDVLVLVDKFYYPVDFVVLDTEPVAMGANYVPIILGRPFLATSNAIINC